MRSRRTCPHRVSGRDGSGGAGAGVWVVVLMRRIGGERSAATLGGPRPFVPALLELSRSLMTHPSGRGRRLATFARAFRWQVGRILGVRRALVRFGPMRLFCYPGYSSASSVLYFGLPEWNEMW